jgi:hypothetical protein
MDSEDEEGPIYSATTGKYRTPKRYIKGSVEGEIGCSLQFRRRKLTFHLRTDADDLSAQASALAIRDTSSAVARVLGSAAGAFDALPLMSLAFLADSLHFCLSPLFSSFAVSVSLTSQASSSQTEPTAASSLDTGWTPPP